MIGKKKVPGLVLVLASVIIITIAAFGVVSAVAGQPEIPDDALISKGYLDAQISLLTKEINRLQQEIDTLNQNGNSTGTDVAVFKVLELVSGQTLIAGEGAEIVLRGSAGGGYATAISGANGDGLADVTAGDGKDLKTGDRIPLNHLLIVSRDDGRGIKVANVENSKVYILVKGPYRIE